MMDASESIRVQKAIAGIYAWWKGDREDWLSKFYTFYSESNLWERAKLSKGCDAEAAAYAEWEGAQDPDTFFAEWGIDLEPKTSAR